ncbi:MAG: hypothetical protein OEW05_11310, partial [Candidatus Aminicenantes bacterium]|nr:hypothetical protein [Candidatus Aminicenantes bacterium]
YRIWRKKKGEDILNYRSLGQVDAGTFFYRDTNVEGLNLDDYTMTAVDDKGRESPIVIGAQGTGAGETMGPPRGPEPQRSSRK